MKKQATDLLTRLQRLNKQQILDRIQEMDPLLFKHLVTLLFEQRGYQTTIADGSGDEGLDIRLQKGKSTAVAQCKRSSGTAGSVSSVGQPTVRELYGTMLHNAADEAYLVTTAQITRQAKEWAFGKPIKFVDGFTVTEWILEAVEPSPQSRFGLGSLFSPSKQANEQHQQREQQGPQDESSPQNAERIYAMSSPQPNNGKQNRNDNNGGRRVGAGFWFWPLVVLAILFFGIAIGIAYNQLAPRWAAEPTIIESTPVSVADAANSVADGGDTETDGGSDGNGNDSTVGNGTGDTNTGDTNTGDTNTGDTNTGTEATAAAQLAQATAIAEATAAAQATQSAAQPATDVPTEAPTATDVPTEIPTATDVPTEAPTATSLPTLAPTPTWTPETATPETTTPAPTDPDLACDIPVDSEFAQFYNSGELGCPTNTTGLHWNAWQAFERGYLLWRSDTDAAYALYGPSQGSWFPISERWDGSTTVPRGEPPSTNLVAPERGFGYVWGIRNDIFENLGWATETEKGFCALIQPYEQGFILQSIAVDTCTSEGLFNQARSTDWQPITIIASANGQFIIR